MLRIRPIDRADSVRPAQRTPDAAPKAEFSRALVTVGGGRTDDPRTEPTQKPRGSGRPLAGFLTQMIVDSDPTLRPSRLERTTAAAALYAEAARRVA